MAIPTTQTRFGDQLGSLVDRDALTRLLLEMVDIPSPTGKEEAFARYLGERFAELGMEIKFQEMEAGRPNVIATLKGTVTRAANQSAVEPICDSR